MPDLLDHWLAAIVLGGRHKPVQRQWQR
jgi:hypothetical protein